MNSVQICGRVVEKPQIGQSQNSVKFSKIRISVERSYKEDEDNHEIFEVVVFRNLAEIQLEVGQYIGVTGKLSSNCNEKDGVKYYNYSIIGNTLSLLGN